MTQFTNVTDTQTPHDSIGRTYALHRAAKTTWDGIRQLILGCCLTKQTSVGPHC